MSWERRSSWAASPNQARGAQVLVEVLRDAASRVAAVDGLAVWEAAGDASASGLHPGVAAYVVGVPVGVDDQFDLALAALARSAAWSAWPTNPLSIIRG